MTLCCLLASSAQLSPAASKPSLTIQRIYLRNLPEVRCYFTVVDPEGNLTSGLTSKEFDLTVDEQHAGNFSVTSISDQKEDSIAIVLIIDKSGSMKGEPLNKAQEAAVDFVQRLGQYDQAAVISFDNRVTIESDFSSSKNDLVSVIRGIQAGSDTALNDAVTKGLEHLEGNDSIRKALIVLTDGKENRSTTTTEALLRRAMDSGVPIYTVGLGSNVSEDVLGKLADSTGGRYSTAPTAEELLTIFRRIAEELKRQYILNYKSPGGADKKWHKVRITLHLKTWGCEGGKQYLASTGTGINPDIVSRTESENQIKGFIVASGLGALIGLIASLFCFVIIKARNIPISAGLKMILSLLLVIFGGVAGVLIVALVGIKNF